MPRLHRRPLVTVFAILLFSPQVHVILALFFGLTMDNRLPSLVGWIAAVIVLWGTCQLLTDRDEEECRDDTETER